eukprot:5766819-Amphidinium_carterae.1
MIAEAKQLCQHTANERHELLSSCQRKAAETVNMLRSQLDAEKANVERVVERQLHSEREKKVRELQAQSDVLMGQARSEFDKVQHELDDLRAQVQSAERERDTSVNQLAAEKIRSTQLQTYSSQLLYEMSNVR